MEEKSVKSEESGGDDQEMMSGNSCGSSRYEERAASEVHIPASENS